MARTYDIESREKNEPLLQPVKVIDNFFYFAESGVYTPPFATEEEWWDGLLTGSEGSVLCSRGETIVGAHQTPAKSLQETLVQPGEEHWTVSGPYQEEHERKHLLRDGSRIKGLREDELQAMLDASKASQDTGETRLIGTIQLPEEARKWSLVFRPNENQILIHSPGTKQLFFYPGFEL